MEDDLSTERLVATRRSLHAVAELVIAGPQHRSHGTIRLRPAAGGFAGIASGVAVVGEEIVHGAVRIRIDGRSCRDLGAALGVEAGAPTELYHDGCGVDLDEAVTLDQRAARVLADWFAVGDTALQDFAPIVPVLWPEHFDLGVALDEVNYGVSPGDGFHAAPYAYAAPWHQRVGSFWNAPFGALRPAEDVPDVAAITAFFAEARTVAE